MGIKQDTEDSLKDFEFTKIDGQPTDEDLNQLTKECTNAASSISTTNGGGQHGHAGMVIPEADYITFSYNAERFVAPTNPGPYPQIVDADAVIRERQIAEHKAEIAEYETYCGVQNFLRKAIIRSVDAEWIAELESETMGFNHRTPFEILEHLRANGGDLDHLDVTELIQQLQKDWDHVEAPATLFARGDKIERQLVKAGQAANPALRLAFVLATFEASGEFDPSIREWKAKPAVDRTFTNFRVFMQRAFTDRTKHNKSTAKSTGRGIANSATDAALDKVDEAEAAALAIAEVAMMLQTNQDKQFKQMMEMFDKVMKTKNSPAETPAQPGQRKVCPHCKRPHAKPEKCWELEANKADRPANWKPIAERKAKAES
jgi:hypothetical protein